MARYISKFLQKNEKIEMIGKLNIILIIPYSIIFLVLLFLWITKLTASVPSPFFENITLNILFMIISVFLLIRIPLEIITILVECAFTELAYTNKRIIGKRGLFTTTILDAPIEKINDVYIKQTLFGKIFQYSSIVISTSSSRYKFKYLKNASSPSVGRPCESKS